MIFFEKKSQATSVSIWALIKFFHAIVGRALLDAVAHAVELAAGLEREAIVLVNLSGRGDKDLSILTGATS